MKARCNLFVIAVLLSGVRVASAQCYTFSSGSAASFSVNITSLPSPTMPSPGIYQYSSGSGTASLTEGETTYTSSGPISLIVTVSSDSSIDFSAFDLAVGFTTADNTIAGASVSLGWSGIFFPNGSLPAALPPIPGSLDPFMVVDVNFAETTYTPDSVGGCSVTSPAPFAHPSARPSARAIGPRAIDQSWWRRSCRQRSANHPARRMGVDLRHQSRQFDDGLERRFPNVSEWHKCDDQRPIGLSLIRQWRTD